MSYATELEAIIVRNALVVDPEVRGVLQGRRPAGRWSAGAVECGAVECGATAWQVAAGSVGACCSRWAAGCSIEALVGSLPLRSCGRSRSARSSAWRGRP